MSDSRSVKEKQVKQRTASPHFLRRVWNQVQNRDEDGSALVIAIASVILTGLLMAVVLSSVMFSIGHTTATRAQAEAKAAAEGGTQQVARYLLRESADATTVCPSDWSFLDPGGYVDYDVISVEYVAENDTSDTWRSCTPSNGIPKMADKIRVTTKGTTQTFGQVGNERGDTAAVQMTYVRPRTVSFNKAIFGDGYASTRTNLILEGSTTGNDDADVLTNGVFDCPASGTVYGNVYALGGLKNGTINTSCSVTGDFYINGDATFASGPVMIGGDLIVLGNLNITGNFRVGGRTIVHGNLNMNPPWGDHSTYHFAGPARVTGNFNAANGGQHYYTQFGNFFKANPAFYLRGTMNAPSGQWNNVQQGIIDGFGGRLRNTVFPLPNNWPEPENSWLNWSQWPEWNSGVTGQQGRDLLNALNIMRDEDHEDRQFPMLTADSPQWTGMAVVNWNDIRSSYGSENTACKIHNPSTPIVINVPTKLDFMGCSELTLQTTNFQLNADLLLIAPKIRKSGPLTLTRATPGDPTRHSMYIVSPADEGQTQCPTLPNAGSVGTDKGIFFEAGGWNQTDPGGGVTTKVLLYSAHYTTLRSQFQTVHGQFYGCSLDIHDTVRMVYAKAGNSSDTTDTLFDLKLDSVRDITDLIAP